MTNRPKADDLVVSDQDAGFRTLFNPSTGERIRLHGCPGTPDSARGRAALQLAQHARGTITEHTHPHQEERFTISAGKPLHAQRLHHAC